MAPQRRRKDGHFGHPARRVELLRDVDAHVAEQRRDQAERAGHVVVDDHLSPGEWGADG